MATTSAGILADPAFPLRPFFPFFLEEDISFAIFRPSTLSKSIIVASLSAGETFTSFKISQTKAIAFGVSKSSFMKAWNFAEYSVFILPPFLLPFSA